MKIAVGAILVLIVVGVAVIGVGYALPVKHIATRAITLPTSPDRIYQLISNPAEFPTWRSRVKTVESIVRADGVVSYQEKGDDGAILYVVDEAIPPKRLVTRIADDKLPFGGQWTYELTSTTDGAQLRITEHGEVYNPVFRFVSRFVFGHHATIETYLKDVARKFQSKAVVIRE